MHFAPRRNWMNDPNGLVFHDGRYHLYFQYNPLGSVHGNISWGHATSTDLTRWVEHAPAILWDDDAQIFSGSVVVDHGNTSGFGTDAAPPLVAIYTAAAPGHQAQSLAYSVDGGYTWTKYDGNPVLDRGTADFRDPKVFRYDDGRDAYWVVVAVEAQDRQVLFHRSDDLKNWVFLSSYGPAGPVGGVWECPDMFPLAVDGDDDDVRWVLLISMNPGGIAGGSGTHYVVGQFDGVSFTSTEPHEAPGHEVDRAHTPTRAELERFGWIDFGRDCYAGVTFDGLARRDRTLIAWMDNWEYAREMPADASSPQRSGMTLPRRLSLVRGVDGAVRLRQRPVVRVEGEEHAVQLGRLDGTAATETRLAGAGRIRIAATLGDARGIEVRLGAGADAGAGVNAGAIVTIRYDRASGRIDLDRSAHAGHLPAAFSEGQSMPVDPAGRIEWEIWVDVLNDEVSSVELFAQDGDRVMTALVPALSGGTVVVSALGGVVSDASLGISSAL
ncbi:glycoside hydrolase family 32 protein [Microbacterium sp. C5A9]|nr:glycoside hydrolase family 32 protein [Microbacterium sp. C5A9]